MAFNSPTEDYLSQIAQMNAAAARQMPASDPGSPYVQRAFNPGRVMPGRNLSSAQAATQRPTDLQGAGSAAGLGSTLNWDKL
jgi:hypothetical protein